MTQMIIQIGMLPVIYYLQFSCMEEHEKRGLGLELLLETAWNDSFVIIFLLSSLFSVMFFDFPAVELREQEDANPRAASC